MDVQANAAARDSSGILFIATVLQQQPSTGGEALRDFVRSNKKIQADSPVFAVYGKKPPQLSKPHHSGMSSILNALCQVARRRTARLKHLTYRYRRRRNCRSKAFRNKKADEKSALFGASRSSALRKLCLKTLPTKPSFISGAVATDRDSAVKKTTKERNISEKREKRGL